MNLTENQKKAVDIIDKNVCVNAGAGTGKTEVLTRRYVNILKNGNLTEGEEVDNIVAITFTKKATNEMKTRVKELVMEEAEEKFIRIYEDIDNSNISTIHSLCGKIIRENSYYLDIDPKFQVLDEKISKKILDEAIVEVIGEDLEKSEFINKLMMATEEYDPDEIVDHIRNFYLESKSKIDDLESLKVSTIERLESIDDKNYIDEIVEELNVVFELLQDIIEKKNPKRGIKGYNTLLEPKSQQVLKGNLQCDYKFLAYVYDNLGSCKAVKENYDYIKELIEKAFIRHEKDYIDTYVQFFDVLLDIDNRIKEKKLALGGLDFNDLEHYTIKLLKNENVLSKLQDKYKYIMVDEYQDTNDFQKEIIYKLCSKDSVLDRNNLFVVGDPKQSIYGFRGANINVFDETREDIKNTGGEIIVFKDNFRSKEDIMDPINEIYSRRMEGRYDKLEAFNKRDDKNNFVIINNDDSKLNREYEAKIVASYLKDNIIYNDKKPGDYTILVRSRSGQDLYEKELSENNIPFYSLNSTGFFSEPEVMDIFNYLELIYDRDNRLALLGVLVSPVYGIDENEIYSLFTNLEDEICIKDIEEYKNLLTENLYNSIFDLYQKIDELEFLYKYRGISGIINEIINYYNLLEKYNYINDDYQSQANIYKLIRISRKYDLEGKNLLEFINDYKLADEKEGLMQIEDEDSNVVKFMTIHGSKGLGFKRTIVPNINKKFVVVKDLFLYHYKKGFGIKLKYAPAFYADIKKCIEEDSVIEMDNVYYVAMTRAKDELVLGAVGRKSAYKSFIYDEMNYLIKEDKARLIENVIEKDEEKSLTLKTRESLDENLLNLDNFDLIYKQKPDDSLSFNTLSISMVLEYINSEEDFYKNYYYKSKKYEESNIDEDKKMEMPGFLRGEIVHRFAEKYELGMDKDKLLTEVLNEFNLNDTYKVYFVNFVENFIYLNDFGEKEVHKELEFHFNFKNNTFVGIIDRLEIDEKSNTIKIIDYKLSSLNKSMLIKKYKYQLIFYGYVMEHIFKDKKIILEIQNLQKKYKEEIEFNDFEKNNLEDILDRFIDGLNNESVIDI